MNIFKDKKVLLVDDMRITRTLLKKFLLKHEAIADNIIEAINGKEAIEILKENRFDLIISDWNMPEVTGIELLEFAKSQESSKETPFILLTSESDNLQIADALKAGVSLYIIKPFQEEDLLQKIMPIMK